MIPCYFCKEQRNAVSACACKPCAQKYQVELVASYYSDQNGQNIDNTKISFFHNKKNYEIVSSYVGNQTYITAQADQFVWRTILTLPGHPLTLDNFRVKLPLYLTFS
jgi:hypothetical protein